jgi:tRNA(Ile)-lysidine synthase
VLERVTRTIREHDMLGAGDRVVVCVSGGPDSVCLLESLVRLRRLFRVRLEVFHFDHGLREGSARDAAYVRRLAERHRLPFHLRAASDRPPKGSSVEMWARYRRLLAAIDVMDVARGHRIALGHTRNDQAETVLMSLMTGSIAGLGGIPPTNGPLIHPLLDVSRAEVEALCRSLHLRPRRDPTNDDVRFLRNAIRHRGLPALERASGREVTGPIARVADLVRADQQRLWDEAIEAGGSVIEVTADGARISVDGLAALPPALLWRVGRRLFQAIDAGWTDSDVEAVLDLARGRPGRRRDLSNGLLARRERVYVSLSSRPSPESRG